MARKQDALDYHFQQRPGKIEVSVTKPCATQRDLSLAYTPGVAEPCRQIKADQDAAYLYTAKGNLVAVISNGTAVLGLGNIGALAGKPVMEGKGVLFKRFADIDVFDIELDETDPEKFVQIAQALAPTFGGINLEDIKAPECFYIERELQRRVNIPVFHDDQHGTAIVSGAALTNAVGLIGKAMSDIKLVVCGAGAAGIACATLYKTLGVRSENITLVDINGVVYKGRTEGMNPYLEAFARETPARTLAEALRGADALLGVSASGVVTADMLLTMAERPIIFAMANPDPEIPYPDARMARPDAIVATGRSDYPNQVNNVLGFPSLFRGALDVRATCVNDAMKVAAVKALASLAREDVPDTVIKAYRGEQLHFGPEYIIPKPFDPRVLLRVAPAVATAAMESGVARVPISDLEGYRDALEARLGKSREVMRVVIHKAQRSPKRIVFPEGDESRVLRASQILLEESIARPVLLGSEPVIREKIASLSLDLEGVQIVDPTRSLRFPTYVAQLLALRKRKGVTRDDAVRAMRRRNMYGMMMVRLGEADGLVSGLTQHYSDTILPALQIVRPRRGTRIIAGVHMMVFKNRTIFITDPTVNIDPTSEDLAEIALLAAETARWFNFEPLVAMLSFSTFGSMKHPLVSKVKKALDLVRSKAPGLRVEGEVEADVAVVPEILNRRYPFNQLKDAANVLVFPDLTSANAAYKLLARLGGATAIGPILAGISKPVHVLVPSSEVNDIVNMTAIAVAEAQVLEERKARVAAKDIAFGI